MAVVFYVVQEDGRRAVPAAQFAGAIPAAQAVTGFFYPAEACTPGKFRM